ncbi:unnamed protein product [Nippostrongylus brasiliensis]|uniref:Aa_trans domain-containing protein n=1 Tax=Nippostrongylus brasiliensis TaxID=27835 RepID=A0A0N4YU75_NIPBR|nr:unnamed protein product [Nippostrongylus brasiliensis]
MTFSQSVSDVETLPHQKSDDRENSLIARPKEKKISTTFALINLMKGMVGPGCFAVPLAFKQGGLWELATAKHIPTSELPAITDMNGIVMAAGSILYALEGQAMVLPLENKMEHPQYMGGLTGVLWTGVPLVTLIYAACGFYGYIAFGNDVQASITLNLSDSPLNFSVKCMLLCVVYSGFLIQQYPLVEILWPLAKQPLRERKIRRAYIIALEYVFRFSIVFVACKLTDLLTSCTDLTKQNTNR